MKKLLSATLLVNALAFSAPLLADDQKPVADTQEPAGGSPDTATPPSASDMQSMPSATDGQMTPPSADSQPAPSEPVPEATDVP